MNYSSRIAEQIRISSDILCMTMSAPEIARNAKPGQFVHLRISDCIDPLLRRPFSIHRVDRGKGEIKLLYRIIGRGTALLAEKKEGEQVEIMGPLGNGFDIQKAFSHAIVVAGGMGSAPVFFLLDELRAAQKTITFLWGARTGCEIFSIDELKEKDIHLLTATEDGSLGETGFVTDCLKKYLNEVDPDDTMGFVCGPEPMIHTVQKLTDKTTFDWQVSVEERMACGVGVCVGCAVPTNTNGFKLACKDGPVFDLREIKCHD